MSNQAIVDEVMREERNDYPDRELEIVQQTVVFTGGLSALVFVVYRFEEPSTMVGDTEVPARERVRWRVRQPGGGGSSGEVR